MLLAKDLGKTHRKKVLSGELTETDLHRPAGLAGADPRLLALCSGQSARRGVGWLLVQNHTRLADHH